jgi:hypothetical protein
MIGKHDTSIWQCKSDNQLIPITWGQSLWPTNQNQSCVYNGLFVHVKEIQTQFHAIWRLKNFQVTILHAIKLLSLDLL